MNDDSEGVAKSLRELASEARRRQGPGAHLDPGTLIAYHRGELTPAAEEDVQEHLAVCRHCARLLLELPSFLEAPDAALETADAAAEASWREIRARLPGTSAPAGRPGAGEFGVRRDWWHRSSPVAAAAMLAAAVLVAVPLWIIARRLAAPEMPPETIELFAPEAQRGTAEPPAFPPATVHARAAATTLLLRLARPQPNLRFRVELLAAGAAGTAGATGATGTAGTTGTPAGPPLPVPAVKVVDSRTLVLVLARRQLAPGQYQLRVLDADQPSAEPLGDYRLAVVDP